MPRAAAALVAIACWAGLAVQFSATYGEQHDVAATLWILARYFTVLTNLIVAAVMTAVATGRRVSPLVLGGVTLAIVLVGIVYALLLQHLYSMTGAAKIADGMLHKVTPLLTVFWWLLFAPRAKLRWSASLWWAVYPLAYFIYSVARGRTDGKYPYPFLDVGHLGWFQTALNAAGIAFGFILCGLLLVWIDRSRPLGSRRSTR
jgi:hypothetical protein